MEIGFFVSIEISESFLESLENFLFVCADFGEFQRFFWRISICEVERKSGNLIVKVDGDGEFKSVGDCR